MEHFQSSTTLPPVPTRNRRIGEFLKELRLAEMRGTGIPKIRRTMQNNGSPEPRIDFDEDRTYFRIILPAHPRYVVVHALREASYLWSIGERIPATKKLQGVFDKNPGAGSVAGQLIEYYSYAEEDEKAKEVLEKFHRERLRHEPLQPYIRYFKVLIGRRKNEDARNTILMIPEIYYDEDPYEVGLAFKRLKINDKAHTILSKIYPLYDNRPEYLQTYAQVKLAIANDIYSSSNRNWGTIRRLRSEAQELLRRAISLFNEKDQQCAWCWFELARTFQFTRARTSQVEEAYCKAIELLPDEKTFREAYHRWKEYVSLKRVTLDD